MTAQLSQFASTVHRGATILSPIQRASAYSPRNEAIITQPVTHRKDGTPSYWPSPAESARGTSSLPQSDPRHPSRGGGTATFPAPSRPQGGAHIPTPVRPLDDPIWAGDPLRKYTERLPASDQPGAAEGFAIGAHPYLGALDQAVSFGHGAASAIASQFGKQIDPRFDWMKQKPVTAAVAGMARGQYEGIRRDPSVTLALAGATYGIGALSGPIARSVGTSVVPRLPTVVQQVGAKAAPHMGKVGTALSAGFFGAMAAPAVPATLQEYERGNIEAGTFLMSRQTAPFVGGMAAGRGLLRAVPPSSFPIQIQRATLPGAGTTPAEFSSLGIRTGRSTVETFRPLIGTQRIDGARTLTLGRPSTPLDTMIGSKPWQPMSPYETALIEGAVGKEAAKISLGRAVRTHTQHAGLQVKDLRPVVTEIVRAHQIPNSNAVTNTMIRIMQKPQYEVELYGSAATRAVAHQTGRLSTVPKARDLDVMVRNSEVFRKEMITAINRAANRPVVQADKAGGISMKKTGEKLWDVHDATIDPYKPGAPTSPYAGYGIRLEPRTDIPGGIKAVTISEQATRKLSGAMGGVRASPVTLTSPSMTVSGRVVPLHAGRIKDIQGYYSTERLAISTMEQSGDPRQVARARLAQPKLDQWLDQWGDDISRSVRAAYQAAPPTPATAGIRVSPAAPSPRTIINPGITPAAAPAPTLAEFARLNPYERQHLNQLSRQAPRTSPGTVRSNGRYPGTSSPSLFPPTSPSIGAARSLRLIPPSPYPSSPSRSPQSASPSSPPLYPGISSQGMAPPSPSPYPSSPAPSPRMTGRIPGDPTRPSPPRIPDPPSPPRTPPPEYPGISKMPGISEWYNIPPPSPLITRPPSPPQINPDDTPSPLITPDPPSPRITTIPDDKPWDPPSPPPTKTTGDDDSTTTTTTTTGGGGGGGSAGGGSGELTIPVSTHKPKPVPRPEPKPREYRTKREPRRSVDYMQWNPVPDMRYVFGGLMRRRPLDDMDKILPTSVRTEDNEKDNKNDRKPAKDKPSRRRSRTPLTDIDVDEFMRSGRL